MIRVFKRTLDACLVSVASKSSICIVSHIRHRNLLGLAASSGFMETYTATDFAHITTAGSGRTAGGDLAYLRIHPFPCRELGYLILTSPCCLVILLLSILHVN